MAENKYDVFISYSRKDYVDSNGNVIEGNIVSRIKKILTQNGIKYWFDEDGIYSGDRFLEIIVKNIRNARMFLFISTYNSNHVAKWTSKELNTAFKEGKKIIPVKCDDSDYRDSIKLLLSDIDEIDCHSNPEKGFTRMVKAIKDSKDKLIEQEQREKELDDARQAIQILRTSKDSLKQKIARLRGELKTLCSDYADNQEHISRLVELLKSNNIATDPTLCADESFAYDSDNLLTQNRELKQQLSELNKELDAANRYKKESEANISRLNATITSSRQLNSNLAEKLHAALAQGCNNSLLKQQKRHFNIALIAACILFLTTAFFIVAYSVASDDNETYVSLLSDIRAKNNELQTSLDELTKQFSSGTHDTHAVATDITIHDGSGNDSLSLSSETVTYLYVSASVITTTDLQNKTVHLKLITPSGLSRGDSSPSGYTQQLDNMSFNRYTPTEINFSGWGYDQKGSWRAGKYTVEIWMDGKCIGKKSFQIS